MKKLFTLLVFAITIIATAQAPQGFNYQATVRNSSGALVINQNVLFKFNIMQNSQTSLPVYSETHQAPTDDLGQVNLTVGSGTATTGTFAGINWANGSYFLGIELNTGSGYVAMGTTQLLSVPYALYANSAGNSQSQGKTSLYLTGNITNAQAAAKIASELGPYTENIYITNTNQLTTVDLSALTTCANIQINNNSILNNVNLNNLIKVEDKIEISDNSELTTLSFPLLTYCSDFSINSDAVSIINIPLLNYINNFSFSGTNSSNPSTSLTTLNFPSLQTIGSYFGVSVCNSLTSVNLPALTNLIGRISINSGSLANVDIHSLASFSEFSLNQTNLFSAGSINLSSYNSTSSTSSATSINLASLTSISGDFYFTNGGNLNMSSLSNCNVLYIYNISSNSLNFPALTSCSNIYIVGPNLTSLSFPVLTTCANISASSSALSINTINSLLHKMLTVSPSVAKNIDFSGQTPLAPPTGQGIIDKQTLINAGNTVTTD